MTTSWRTIILAGIFGVQVFLQLGGGGSLTPGPREVTIYNETANKTPAFNQLCIALRNGEYAKYLLDRKTDLEILDVTDNPSPDPTVGLPSIFIEAAGSVIYKGACPQDAPSVMEVIKKNGG